MHIYFRHKSVVAKLISSTETPFHGVMKTTTEIMSINGTSK